MGAPLASVGFAVVGGESVGNVEIVRDRSVPLFDRLVEIDRIIERLQPGDFLRRHVGDAQRRGDLELEDRDAVGPEVLHGLHHILELHRLVTDVVDGAEMLVERVIALGGGQAGPARQVVDGGAGVEVVV